MHDRTARRPPDAFPGSAWSEAVMQRLWITPQVIARENLNRLAENHEVNRVRELAQQRTTRCAERGSVRLRVPADSRDANIERPHELGVQTGSDLAIPACGLANLVCGFVKEPDPVTG